MTARSLIIPIYRNAESVPRLLEALEGISAALNGELEVVFVVDGSPDESGALLLERAPKCSFPSKVAFHSRNFGSFTAIRTGMELAQGEHLAVMAADLQEPPELMVEFFRVLAAGRAEVVFAKREGRGDPLLSRLLSAVFWRMYRRFILPDMPAGGIDVFACCRKVRDAVLEIEEPNSSLIAQLFWVGFRREFIPYMRRPRLEGKSAWALSRRFRYMMDSIFSFSDLPIMVVLWLGVIGCTISSVLGLITLGARLAGYIQEAGYTSIILLIAFLGSLILAVQGILGCYLWRATENSKRRPLRIISRVVHLQGDLNERTT
ncbi:glycosyltransferase family 2 protein [Dongia deserti]|uniref:glycosyltransferase family 2 protein n=1 Tax=Dongia deserti TaxID=2268030 RepID=UPI000E650197|nr:glycosyltransferase family 2 protein [Dongia deserti]